MHHKFFSVTPAQQGYFYRETVTEDGAEKLAYDWEPILAWGFCNELENPVPLTVSGEPSYLSGRGFYIKDPYGVEQRHLQYDFDKEEDL